MAEPTSQTAPQENGRNGETDRRSVLAGATMGAALAAGYGTFFFYSGRYLYPTRAQRSLWQFVARVRDLELGQALAYRTPAGATVTITRRSNSGEVRDFTALSSTCPHLGCKVHWEPHNTRFFCPCHNGVFTPEGEPVSGPPADANQPLKQFPLKVENGLLFIEAPL